MVPNQMDKGQSFAVISTIVLAIHWGRERNTGPTFSRASTAFHRRRGGVVTVRNELDTQKVRRVKNVPRSVCAVKLVSLAGSVGREKDTCVSHNFFSLDPGASDASCCSRVKENELTTVLEMVWYLHTHIHTYTHKHTHTHV